MTDIFFDPQLPKQVVMLLLWARVCMIFLQPLLRMPMPRTNFYLSSTFKSLKSLFDRFCLVTQWCLNCFFVFFHFSLFLIYSVKKMDTRKQYLFSNDLTGCFSQIKLRFVLHFRLCETVRLTGSPTCFTQVLKRWWNASPSPFSLGNVLKWFQTWTNFSAHMQLMADLETTHFRGPTAWSETDSPSRVSLLFGVLVWVDPDC